MLVGQKALANSILVKKAILEATVSFAWVWKTFAALKGRNISDRLGDVLFNLLSVELNFYYLNSNAYLILHLAYFLILIDYCCFEVIKKVLISTCCLYFF